MVDSKWLSGGIHYLPYSTLPYMYMYSTRYNSFKKLTAVFILFDVLTCWNLMQVTVSSNTKYM